jgi:hypothetical protein
MNHVVILDAVANEIEDLLRGDKSMICRGADVINIPYGIVEVGDVLYFVNNNDHTVIKAKGVVSSVYNSCRLSPEESYEMIIRNQDKLRLPDDLFYKWAGKKYLLLIGVRDVQEIKPLLIDRNILINTVYWNLTVCQQKMVDL